MPNGLDDKDLHSDFLTAFSTEPQPENPVHKDFLSAFPEQAQPKSAINLPTAETPDIKAGIIPPPRALTPTSPETPGGRGEFPLADRGAVMDVLTAPLRGTTQAVEQTARFIRAPGNIATGKKNEFLTSVIEGTTNLQKRYPYLFGASQREAEGGISGAISGGITSLVPSVAAALPGAAAGFAIGTPAGPPGQVAGAIAGAALSGGTVMGLAEIDRYLDESEQAGKTREESLPYAIASGMIEGGGEGLANYLGLKLLGPAGKVLPKATTFAAKQALRENLGAFVKQVMTKQMPIEVGTEMFQEAGEAKVRQMQGLETDTPWESAKGAIGPTVVMTAIFGAGARVGFNRQYKKMTGVLKDTEASPEERWSVAQLVGKNLMDGGRPDLASTWYKEASPAIFGTDRKPIDLDKVLAEPGPPSVAGPVDMTKEKAAGPEEAIPLPKEPPQGIGFDMIQGKPIVPAEPEVVPVAKSEPSLETTIGGLEKEWQRVKGLEGLTPEVKPVEGEAIAPSQEAKAKEEAIPAKVEAAAAEAAMSPISNLPEPTEAQKKAGNYPLGHLSLHGLDISIENPRDSIRSGVDKAGKPWSTTMASHYGYIRKTEGKDGDHVDTFIGPYPQTKKVFVVDQVDPDTGKFDEHKSLIGFRNAAEARKGYLANYDPGWKGLGGMKAFSLDEFKEWVKGDTTKPVTKLTTKAIEPVTSPTAALAEPKTLKEAAFPAAIPAAPAAPRLEAVPLQAGEKPAPVVEKPVGIPEAAPQKAAAEVNWNPKTKRYEAVKPTPITPVKAEEKAPTLTPTQAEKVAPAPPGEAPKAAEHPVALDMTGAAARYANGLKNKLKKHYAWEYTKWRIGQREAAPEARGLSDIAGQTIRTSVDRALGEGKAVKPSKAVAAMLPEEPTTKGGVPLSEAKLSKRLDRAAELRREAERWQAEQAQEKAKPAAEVSVAEGGNPFKESKIQGIVYHGTDKSFEKFGVTKDIGFHFGDNATSKEWVNQLSQYYKKPKREYRVEPYYLDLRNPLEMPDLKNWDTQSLFYQARKHGFISKDSSIAEFASDSFKAGFKGDHQKYFVDLAKKAGYDGVVYQNVYEGGKSYIAFEPGQIIKAKPAPVEAKPVLAETPKPAEKVEEKPAEAVKAGRPEEVPAEKKAETPVSATEDSGVELTYNKRNRIKTGIKWDDIADKNTALKVKETTKQNIYPRPDYEKMITDGMQPMVANLVKQVYDSLPAKPATAAAPTDADLKLYIDAVNRVMDGTTAWATDKEAIAAWAGKQVGVAGAMAGRPTSVTEMAKSAQGLLDTVYPGGWKNFRAEVILLGGNKVLRGLQPGYEASRRAMKAIKEGWPVAQESWQKQGYKVLASETAITIKKGPDFGIPGNPERFSLIIDEHLQFGEKLHSREAAESAKRDYKPWLVIDKRGRPKGWFNTETEAVDAVRDFVKRESKDKISDKGISVKAAERVGAARRLEGENITSDRLREEFGFKGVNFGNWLKGESNMTERQLHLNHAYDSFLDLADALGVPPKAMSLDGMLGLAIGAQGTGAYAAHFVPGVNEINLTRTSGAGSLAHEFGHALDHYFATQAGLAARPEPFLTEHTSEVDAEGYTKRASQKVKAFEVIRPEIVAKFKAIVEAMNKKPASQDAITTATNLAKDKAKKNVAGWLKAIGADFRAPTNAEHTSEAFDKIAARILAIDLGEGRVAVALGSGVSPAVADLRDLYRKETGRVYGLKNIKSLQANIDHYAYLNSERAAQRDHIPQMVATDYARTAQKLDKEKGGKRYWSTNLEKFARAFDAYVSDTLKENAAKNTYLSHAGRAGETVPVGEERSAINKGFKALIGEIKTQKTEQGVAMFSLGREKKGAGFKAGDFVEFDYKGKTITGKIRDVDEIGKTAWVMNRDPDTPKMGDGQTTVVSLENIRPLGKQGLQVQEAELNQVPYRGQPPRRELRKILDIVAAIAPAEVRFHDRFMVDLRTEKTRKAMQLHGYSEAEIDYLIDTGQAEWPVAGSTTFEDVAPNQVRAMIDLSIAGKDIREVAEDSLHEAFEAIRHIILTPAEQEILNRKIPGRGNKAASEIQADSFADYVTGKPGAVIPRSVKTIFDKIMSWLERFGNAIRLLGFRSAEDIFQAAASGQLLRRYQEATKGGAEQSAITSQAARLQAYAPTYYSQMQTILEKKLPGTQNAGDLAGLIDGWAKKGEFKAEELKWSGLPEWLQEKEGRVAKQEVIDFLNNNRLQIREEMKGVKEKVGFTLDQKRRLTEFVMSKTEGDRELAAIVVYQAETGTADAISDLEGLGLTGDLLDAVNQLRLEKTGYPVYAKYTQPGGKNYRELLFSLPVPRYESRLYDLRPVGDGNYEVMRRDNGSFVGQYPTLQQAQNAIADLDDRPKPYQSSHWKEPNVLAHVRFNERTDAEGNRILFMEEIQSDWHQEGREQGYQEEHDKARQPFLDFLRAKGAIPQTSGGMSIDLLRKAGASRDMINRFEAYAKSIKGMPIPNAPFQKTWYEFALKRMLRWAAENGFDQIAWTTGEQQAARYDLTKQVSSVGWKYYPLDNHYSIGVRNMEGTLILSKGNLTETDIADHLGKELAQRIVKEAQAGRGDEKAIRDGKLSGLDLKIGGEGMKGFYDEIIPKFLNKYAKRWDAKVEETRLAYKGEFANIPLISGFEIGGVKAEVPKEGIPVHSLSINDAMKRDVLYSGQPRFKLQPEIEQRLKILKDPTFPANAAKDKRFNDTVKKNRFGLVKVTDNDLKLWERATSLPFWLMQDHPELRPFVQTQMKREEARSEIIHGLLQRAQPFFALKGEALKNAETALVAGDAQGKIFTDKELADKFKLDKAGIAGYQAVRGTLDWVHREWKDRIEESVLRDYQNEKWFGLFKAAHGIELTDDETMDMGGALRKVYRATEKPLETVKKHLQKIFEEKLTQEDKRLLVKDYVEAYKKARKELDAIKAVIKETIGEGMTEEQLNQNTKELVLAYVQSLPAMTQLKEMRDELNKIKGYFPRVRPQGKYRVAVIETVEDEVGNLVELSTFYTNAKNRIEATKIYNKLKADPEYKDKKIIISVNKTEPESTFLGASTINLQRLVNNAIDTIKAKGEVDAKDANDIKMNVLQTLADQLRARGAGRFAIHRAERVIKGYKTEGLKESLKDYIDGWTGMITKQDAALEFLNELKQIPKGKPQLMDYASKYTQDMLRNQEQMDRISSKMRAFAFTYYLGGSLRAAAVQFTQNYITGIPILAREVGAKSLRAEKLYHKAMFDSAMGKNLNPIEARMLEELLSKGISEAQFIRQITREIKGSLGKWTGMVVDILAKPFSWMETFNRKSAGLAMFRAKIEQYRAQGMAEEPAYRKAFNDAEAFIYKTHYLMTKANLPSWAAGGDVGSQFAKTAYTFRRFTHNYLLSLYHSTRGPDGRLALDVIARSMAYLVLLGGITSIPFWDDLMEEMERLFGIPARAEMRKTMRDIGGPTLETMGIAGIPALMGVNITGSLRTGIPFVGETPQDTIYGVFGGMYQKGKRALESMGREDYRRALETISPIWMESIMKAYRMADQGATTAHGKAMFDEQGRPIKLTPGEAVAQTAGFRPARMAEISGEERTRKNVTAYYNEKRAELYDRFRLAKDPEDRERIRKQVMKFNLEVMKYRGAIPPITKAGMKAAVREQPQKRRMLWGRMFGENPQGTA